MGNLVILNSIKLLLLITVFYPSKAADQQIHCLWPALSGPCERCELGWYGDRCQHKCINCDIGGCGKRNRTCYQCSAGYYTTACTTTCPPHCRESYDGKVYCDRETGKCLEYCKPGWWGNRCETKCSERCVDNACFFYDGSCVNNCKQGWTGKTCDIPCSSGCLNDSCSRYGTHECSHGCKRGYHGHHCDNICSTHCVDQDCYHNHHLKTVACRVGCTEGWWSSNCQLRCPRNCRSCNRETSVCLKCKTGFWGQNCSPACSDRCLVCDMKGKCKQCKRGYFGQRCERYCGDKCLNCLEYEPCGCHENCSEGYDECLGFVGNNGIICDEDEDEYKQTLNQDQEDNLGDNSGQEQHATFNKYFYTCVMLMNFLAVHSK